MYVAVSSSNQVKKSISWTRDFKNQVQMDKDTFVTIMCHNDELGWTMSWVIFLLTDKGLPDK